ncbi:MAG: hypothetical protein IPP71_04860 [Bacteroidetes bacterium]|nr:hypothetical protein [Bacteroidota bacterium]
MKLGSFAAWMLIFSLFSVLGKAQPIAEYTIFRLDTALGLELAEQASYSLESLSNEIPNPKIYCY